MFGHANCDSGDCYTFFLEILDSEDNDSSSFSVYCMEPDKTFGMISPALDSTQHTSLSATSTCKLLLALPMMAAQHIHHSLCNFPFAFLSLPLIDRMISGFASCNMVKVVLLLLRKV